MYRKNKKNLEDINILFIIVILTYSLAFKFLYYFFSRLNMDSKFVVTILASITSFIPIYITDKKDYIRTIEEGKGLDFKSYLFAFFIMIFLNNLSYYFSMGIETNMNKIGYSIIVSSSVNMGNSDYMVRLCYSILVAPLVEELIYRDYFFSNLNNYGTFFGIIVSSLFFGIMHENLPQFALGFSLGILLSLVYIITGSVRPVVILHMLNNLYGTLYNEFIYGFLKNDGDLQKVLLMELLIFTVLAIIAIIYFINYTDAGKILREKKIAYEKIYFKEYIKLKSTWIIVAGFIVAIINSISKI